MEFVLPTTKDEMYLRLEEIFKFYKLTRYGYQKVELSPVTIKRLDKIEMTDEELYEKAKTELSGQHLREIEERKEEAREKNFRLKKELDSIDEELDESVLKLNELFLESVENVKKEAVKKGLLSSDFICDKIARLECEKNKEIVELTSKNTKRKTEISAEIESNNGIITTARDYFEEIHSAEILAKVEVYKKEIAKENQEREVYNSKLDEKDDKYRNSVIRQQAELEIQFMQIRNGEYTESELVDMGYYKDVLDCVRAYYDTLDVDTAYNDMLSEDRLITYLDRFYHELLYVYRQKVIDSLDESFN